MVSDLKAWEEEHGEIPRDSVILMYSGHGKHYTNRTKYFGYPPGVLEKNPKDTENLHFPGFHVYAIQWLVDQRN